jgi:hypothetical protein
MSSADVSSGIPVDNIFGESVAQLTKPNHRKQVDEQIGLFSDNVVCFATKFNELLEIFGIPSTLISC